MRVYVCAEQCSRLATHIRFCEFMLSSAVYCGFVWLLIHKYRTICLIFPLNKFFNKINNHFQLMQRAACNVQRPVCPGPPIQDSTLNRFFITYMV